MGWALAVFSFPALSGWGRLAVFSPIFETCLLLFLSGVPLLKRAGEKKWGSEPAYRRYIAETPLLIPWLK